MIRLVVMLLVVSYVQLSGMENTRVFQFEGEFYNVDALRQLLNVEQVSDEQQPIISQEQQSNQDAIYHAIWQLQYQQKQQLEDRVNQWRERQQQFHVEQLADQTKKRKRTEEAASPQIENSRNVPAKLLPKDHVVNMNQDQINNLLSQVTSRQEKREQEQKDNCYTFKITLPEGFTQEQVCAIAGTLWLKKPKVPKEEKDSLAVVKYQIEYNTD